MTTLSRALRTVVRSQERDRRLTEFAISLRALDQTIVLNIDEVEDVSLRAILESLSLAAHDAAAFYETTMDGTS